MLQFLKQLIKKNIQLAQVISLIVFGILITLAATYIYYWLRSPITLAAIWLSGLIYIYLNSYLMGFRGRKYQVDRGKYLNIARDFMDKSNLSLYRLYIKKRKIPNAYAISFGPLRSIVLNSSLCEILPPKQLEAVIAHEVGHHAHNDALIGTIIGGTVLDGLAYFSVQISIHFHGGLVGLSVISAVLAVAALLVGTLYSRQREARADAYIYRLTGKPQLQADALETMQRYYTEVQGWTLKENAPLWYRLFTTHTPTPERIKILRQSSHR